MPRRARGSLSLQEIRKTARATVAVLATLGFTSCLFGSAACSMYGMRNRVPNDVDIIVLTEMEVEDIKDELSGADPRFHLVPSANPRNTYQVLWYNVTGNRYCKVDILKPGVLNIPPINPRHITYTNVPGVPVIPLLPLLFLKLQGWTDHRDSNLPRMRDKMPVDEEDIDELLRLAVDRYQVKLRTERGLKKWFVEDAERRVAEFIEEFPLSAAYWEEIGFQV